MRRALVDLIQTLTVDIRRNPCKSTHSTSRFVRNCV